MTSAKFSVGVNPKFDDYCKNCGPRGRLKCTGGFSGGGGGAPPNFIHAPPPPPQHVLHPPPPPTFTCTPQHFCSLSPKL